MSLRLVLRPRRYSTASPRSNPHANWYAQVLPSMFPIALLASTVYLGLQLARTQLATERQADEYEARIDQLEQELQSLRQQSPSSPNPSPEHASLRSRRWYFF